jgi:predicted Fe-Mo cluster-binding NifX family protein
MDTKNLKIAFVTDDGNTISQHFGRAQFYEVVTIENGSVVQRERREKAGHHTFHGQEEHGEHHGPGHGFDEHSQGKHRMMTTTIMDCQMLVARGMGNGAYQHMVSANIKPIITSIPTIDNAVQEIIKGTIVNHEEKLH